MKSKWLPIIVVALITIGIVVVWFAMTTQHSNEVKYSCQSRCEPRRWLLITDHCYCRDMPDEWHGIDEDNRNKKETLLMTPSQNPGLK